MHLKPYSWRPVCTQLSTSTTLNPPIKKPIGYLRTMASKLTGLEIQNQAYTVTITSANARRVLYGSIDRETHLTVG